MRFLVTLLLTLSVCFLQAQEVFFTPLEFENEKGTAYDIIGRVGKHILVYRSLNKSHAVLVYNDSMLPVKKVALSFLPPQLVKVDFINISHEFYLFFQFVSRDRLYLSAAKFNDDAKLIQEPLLLDSLIVEDPADFRPFRLIANANRSKIMAYAFWGAGNQLIKVRSCLFSRQMEPLDRSELLIASPNGEEMLREFQLDNIGNLIFFRGILDQETELFSRADVLIKPFLQDTVKFASIKVNDIAVRDIRLQVDNANNRIIAAAMFGSGRKMDVSGVFTVAIDVSSNNIIAGKTLSFPDSLRDECKLKNIPSRSTFNDYIIDEIIPFKAGGHTLLIERRSSVGSRISGISSRFYTDNMLPPAIVFSGMTGNIPIFYNIGSPFDPFRQPVDPKSFVKNEAGNLIMISINPSGDMSDLQMLRKGQIEENSSDLISYTTIKTATGLRFFFNEKQKAGLVPNVIAFSPGSRLKRIPTFRDLLPGYRFAMRKGIQTGPSESVIPCISNNYISFARVQF